MGPPTGSPMKQLVAEPMGVPMGFYRGLTRTGMSYGQASPWALSLPRGLSWDLLWTSPCIISPWNGAWEKHSPCRLTPCGGKKHGLPYGPSRMDFAMDFAAGWPMGKAHGLSHSHGLLSSWTSPCITLPWNGAYGKIQLMVTLWEISRDVPKGSVTLLRYRQIVAHGYVYAYNHEILTVYTGTVPVYLVY